MQPRIRSDVLGKGENAAEVGACGEAARGARTATSGDRAANARRYIVRRVRTSYYEKEVHMESEKYYDPSGREHTVKSEWSFGSFVIYVDGEFYATADDRLDRRETIDELVKNRFWSGTKPRNKNTPPKPASNVAE